MSGRVAIPGAESIAHTSTPRVRRTPVRSTVKAEHTKPLIVSHADAEKADIMCLVVNAPNPAVYYPPREVMVQVHETRAKGVVKKRIHSYTIWPDKDNLLPAYAAKEALSRWPMELRSIPLEEANLDG